MKDPDKKHIHFIAIGGAAMHNLAIALHKKGYYITGSDDEIFEPSRGRLKRYGLLPEDTGWDKNRISPSLDAIILGMHARKDNPELQEAQKLGLKIYSYPEYIYEQTKNKTRVVIGGSHGKTTVTSMIMHVLRETGVAFDYLVGSMVEGFETMAGLSSSSKVAILEGDEYLSSPLDLRPKFHLYHPHIAVITGIAWDHINVFPTFDEYVQQFKIFTEKIEPGGTLIHYQHDPYLNEIIKSLLRDIRQIPYEAHPAKVENNQTSLLTPEGLKHLKIFGKHNLENLESARQVCLLLGISLSDFYTAIQTFGGAGKRLQPLGDGPNGPVYIDFAHSPSKLRATIDAVKQQYPERHLVACMELHTFSSLNKDFLDEYKHSMNGADTRIIFFNPDTITHKKLSMITKEDVRHAFGDQTLMIHTEKQELFQALKQLKMPSSVLLLMSSGNFGGINLDELLIKSNN